MRRGGDSRLQSFLLGGILGGLAGLAAGRLRSAQEARRRSGLAAFEEAPCYRERLEAAEAEHERRARP